MNASLPPSVVPATSATPCGAGEKAEAAQLIRLGLKELSQ